METPTGPDRFVLVERVEKFLNDLAKRPIWRSPKTAYSPQGLAYATFNRRMMASMLDACVLTLLLIPFNNLIMGYVYSGVHLESIPTDQILSNTRTQQEANIEILKSVLDAGMLHVFAILAQIQYTLLAAYSFVFWHFYAATPGKMVMRLRIVDAKTGAPITDRQSVVRLIGYLVSGMALMIGFFAISWSSRRQGWHDVMAGTVVVVKARRAKSAPQAGDPSGSPAPSAGE